MKKYNFNTWLLAGFASIIWLSCGKKNTVVPPDPLDGKIIVVNTISGSTAQDFYQNDTKLTTTALAYGEASSSLPAKGGQSDFSFRDNAQSAQKNANVSLYLNGAFATLFLVADGSGKSTILYGTNSSNAPATGKVKVRFINLSTVFNSELSITYTATQKSVITGTLKTTKTMTEPAGTDYIEIDANTGITVAVTGSANNPKVDMPADKFVVGKNYTIWFDATDNVTPKYHIVTENP